MTNVRVRNHFQASLLRSALIFHDRCNSVHISQTNELRQHGLTLRGI